MINKLCICETALKTINITETIHTIVILAILAFAPGSQPMVLPLLHHCVPAPTPDPNRAVIQTYLRGNRQIVVFFDHQINKRQPFIRITQAIDRLWRFEPVYTL